MANYEDMTSAISKLKDRIPLASVVELDDIETKLKQMRSWFGSMQMQGAKMINLLSDTETDVYKRKKAGPSA